MNSVPTFPICSKLFHCNFPVAMTTSKRCRISKQRQSLMAGVQEEWTFRLALIRHGETNQNRNKIIQAKEVFIACSCHAKVQLEWEELSKYEVENFLAVENFQREFKSQNDTVLNETGKEQVELVGNRFKYEHLTRIYSSDLERALKTAEGICLRNVHLKDLKICIDTSLRERNYGEAEGKSRQELKKMLSFGKLPHGAEAESQVQKRVVDFFTKLLRDVNQLRKSHQSKLKTNDLSLQGQFSQTATPSIVDLNGEIRKSSRSDPSSDQSKAALNNDSLQSPDGKHRATSFPVTNENKKVLLPVLLKDLCHHLDDSGHTDRPIHVAVVSHGGVLRHLVSYFAKNFQSQFPVDKRKLLRQICPNTGVSEFMVHLQGRKVTNIDCLQLYDKSHLYT